MISRVSESLAGKRFGGFYTEEIREDGVRQGFRLLSFDNREWLFAHVDLPKHHHVSKYGVDVSVIDAATEALLTPRSGMGLYLIDEVGKMECFSSRFISAMWCLLDGNKTIIGTVGKKGSGFITEIKQRNDCLLWEITQENRDEMPTYVFDWVNQKRKT